MASKKNDKVIKIGVSSCFFYPDPQRATFGPKTLCYFERDMARYLSTNYKEHFIMPILIPDIESPHWEEMLGQMDGFVFQGGSDIAPATYGETMIQNGRWPGDPHRDQYELKIMDYAFQHKKPILGICRGFQLINVFFKGTLHQDIPSEVKSSTLHRDALQYDAIHHQVSIEKGHLKAIYPNHQTAWVNSVHHQGVKKLGEGLEVEARSCEDQMVEGVSYERDGCFVLGVQWHPEFSHTLKNKVIESTPLYHYFLDRILRSLN